MLFFTAALRQTQIIFAGSKKCRRKKKASAYSILGSTDSPNNADAFSSANGNDQEISSSAQPANECAATSSSRNAEAAFMVPRTSHCVAANVFPSAETNDEVDYQSVLQTPPTVTAQTGDATLESNVDIDEATVYPPLRSRKRQHDEQNWKQNIHKRARNSGKEYMTQGNKKVEEQRLKVCRCGKCTNHCNDLLPENKRHELFHNYWKMGNWQRQRDYIAHHDAIKNTKRKTTTNSRRK